jgi:hypothetical protein
LAKAERHREGNTAPAADKETREDLDRGSKSATGDRG